MTDFLPHPESEKLLELPIALQPIETGQRIEGRIPATTGFQQVSTVGEAEIGVWEMSPGSMQDIEADEYFVVLSGRGKLQILGSGGFSAQEIELATGTAVRLKAGMHTRWDVTETLRKIYFTL